MSDTLEIDTLTMKQEVIMKFVDLCKQLNFDLLISKGKTLILYSRSDTRTTNTVSIEL